ncbi:hypothetical protein L6164_011617 [Bauhinia variegata]|uniref:Uncharacterized protein n=1 Tax=Bauhinia variegata TaxID=167791 RepID=A0ACB9P6N2_BAUVA|nr:hypothetical protein L6164_011617 [Bauhinia variegata]
MRVHSQTKARTCLVFPPVNVTFPGSLHAQIAVETRIAYVLRPKPLANNDPPFTKWTNVALVTSTLIVLARMMQSSLWTLFLPLQNDTTRCVEWCMISSPSN